jgi:hypothetical protein
VANINNGIYTIFNEVTSSDSPDYGIGSISGGFAIYNSDSGVNIYTEIPVDEDLITEAYSMSLTFDALFVNPAGGELSFVSTMTSELGDVDIQEFNFEIISIPGCIDSSSCSYNENATIDDDSCQYLDDCGICGGDNTSCVGCTFSIACNYDPEALIDDASCIFYCPGCTDLLACNYDNSVIQDDGSCLYPENGYDCDGECYIDTDEDGICDENEILGCLDSGACNFNVNASENDFSCEYTSCVGCTYEYACNYDPEALIPDNAICEFGTCAGCTDDMACNYNPTISEDDGSCEYCSCSDCTNGCADPAACNFDQYAFHVQDLCIYTDECGVCGGDGIADGACDCDGNYIDALGVCGGGCLSDINGNDICDNLEIMGCTYSMALNYEPEATIDVGTCEFGEIASDCPSDLDGNGNVGSEDLLLFLADYDMLCEDL